MFNEGAPEFIIDQGLYYQIAANQGYYCTGFESPGEWDDHHKFFAVDGVDVQYPGIQTENMPYVYYNYTPSYEYAQSPYNPYNPYIPGAMIGVDGQFAGNQQFYAAVPQYQNGAPSSYYPVVVQSRPDIFANGSLDNIPDAVLSVGGRPATQGLKHNLSSSSAPFTMIPPKAASGSYSSAKAAEGKSASAGPSKQPATHVRGAYGSLQSIDNISKGRIQSSHSQFKPSLQYSSGLLGSASDAHGQSVVDKLHSRFHHDRSVTNVNESPAVLIEQNKGPRTSKPKSLVAVKANTIVAHCDSLVNIASQCNKSDFLVDYVSAKFFVIKSYSEDDVHKSVKYNVWSSTPNGNKKLDHAYKEAQIIAAGKPTGCPVFLFFSVNASGQYCGVAEMIGPVDFQEDMDFWQQDKWSGSFSVKWHIIKDVPNTNFRQITLENNENKPVTNSRDTQEILFKPGLEMLRIMKNHTMKTSLLDDFMYYEDRQKIMQDGKARILVKSYGTALFVPTLDPPRKLTRPLAISVSKDGEPTDHTNLNQHEISTPSVTDQGSPYPEIDQGCSSSGSNDTNASTSKDDAEDDLTSVIKIGSLTINPKHSGVNKLPNASAVVNPKPVDAVMVSSVPVKLNGMSESSGLFTVGTIPLDPRAIKLQK